MHEVFVLLALIFLGFFLRLGLLDEERIEEYIDKANDTKDLEHASPAEPENQRHDDDRCQRRADIVRRKDPRGESRTQLTREVFGDGAIAGTSIRTFAEAEDEPKEKQSRQGRCMPCREGEDGPQRQCDKDDRLRAEMVREPAPRDLHDRVADEESRNDDTHFCRCQIEIFRHRRQREPDRTAVDIGYTESYIQEEKYDIPVFALQLFQKAHRKPPLPSWVIKKLHEKTALSVHS